jgi:hypothetical protein
MDIQRVYRLVSFLVHEDRELSMQAYLAQLSQALNELRQNPNHAQIQERIVSLRDEFAASMRKFEERVTPEQRMLIAAIGGKELFSASIVETIEYEMQRNSMAPAVIAAKVQELTNTRQGFLTQLETLIKAIDFFKITHEDLQPGDADIAFSIPRTLFGNNLAELAGELSAINGIIRPFSETAIGKVETVEVRQISTSDPTFFFHIKPATIEAIGKTITWLIKTLKGLFELRKLRQDAEKVLGKAENDLQVMFDQKIEQHINEAVRKQTQELLAKYPLEDNGRRNELEIALDLAQRKLLFRIERGMTVAVRSVLPPGGGESIYVSLMDISHELQFPAIEGPPILRLPPSDNQTSPRPAKL